MPSPEVPARHGWVRLAADWADHLRSPLAEAERGMVEDWRTQGRPLVVARRQPADDLGTLRLGLATPDKRRIGVHLATAAIRDPAGPLALADALPSAPAPWRPRLEAMLRRAEVLGVTAGVFGSLAWQHRTGLPYVRPGSDLDLLFAPRRWSVVEGLLGALSELDMAEDPRLDGEIQLPDGSAVAWRELAARPAKLLVKGDADVTLRDTRAVITLFPPE